MTLLMPERSEARTIYKYASGSNCVRVCVCVCRGKLWLTPGRCAVLFPFRLTRTGPLSLSREKLKRAMGEYHHNNVAATEYKADITTWLRVTIK